jgi:catechol 2,3-dioxygenase-like lactoylglutathione lyase family enzyme
LRPRVPFEVRLLRVNETVLYASDAAAAATFYSDVLGLRPPGEADELGAVARLGDGGVLLIFASFPG